MDMNYLVQRRINAQKRYRRKVTLTIALGAILLVLILIGLIKLIVDEKKADERLNELQNRRAMKCTPVFMLGYCCTG